MSLKAMHEIKHESNFLNGLFMMWAAMRMDEDDEGGLDSIDDEV